MNKENGFSLIELVVSLFVASLLITLIMQQYLIAKGQFKKMQLLMEQAIELEMVMDLIRDSVRRGGYTPCQGISSLESIDRRTNKIKLAAIETKTGKDNYLQINRMNEYYSTLIKQLSPTQLLVKSNISYENQQAILISDCYHAEVQESLEARKTAAGTIITLKKPLAFNYASPVYLGEWIEEKFFMKKNKKGHNSLFYKKNHVDELSDFINLNSVDLNSLQGKSLVKLNLETEFLKSQHLVTRVRAE